MQIETGKSLSGTERLWCLIARDLFSATGRGGVRAFFAALLFSPSFCAALRYRLSVAAYRNGYLRISLLLWKSNMTTYGCHLSPMTNVGGGLLLPHPVGVVLGEGVELGVNVTLYQNVTIGKGRDGYPRLGDRVTVFPNSVVFGEVDIGPEVVIGAGSIVRSSIEGGSTVSGNPLQVVRRSAGDAA